MTSPPLRLLFGLHIHQPVGNFHHVFEQHAKDVYHPLLELLARRSPGPVLLHVSGPLLEWMQTHDTALVDRIGRGVSDCNIELLLGGMYEPILAAIARADRVDQIARHRAALRSLFGATGNGLWLTERVWEPELPADLHDAGVRYVFVDDRHFLASGFAREELHVPYRSEFDSKPVTVLAIDQRLRYLIPFRPPSEFDAYVRSARDAGHALAVFADDGEKFGGWPGTKEWVYDRGWFEQFCDTLDSLRESGVARLTTGADVLANVPSDGPAYLPTASYEEMEQWALPATPARRLTALRAELGEARTTGPEGPLVRGSHWRNFLHKYPEANRLHKKTTALSALCRARGEPADVRVAVAKAQCNDALWHGVFGGLYLPHLRAALWHELANAEAMLRAREDLAWEALDFDFDGHDEIWVHSAAYSAIIAPARGGALIEYTRFASGANHADTLTRRVEAYHLPAVGHHSVADGGAASIHDSEAGLGMDTPPPADPDDRAIGVARLIRRDLAPDEYAHGRYVPLYSWARARCSVQVTLVDADISVTCQAPGYTVVWRLTAAFVESVSYRWDPALASGDAWFAPECSVAHGLEVRAPQSAATWRQAIETVTKSERGIDRIVQGEAVTPLFDASTGEALVTFG